MTKPLSLERLGVPYLHRLTDTDDVHLINQLLQSTRAFFLINERDAQGYCALHRACARGKYAATKALLKHGADVKCLDWNGETPLHWAVAAEETPVVALLLKFGANPLQPSFDGKSPIDLAVTSNHTSILQLLYTYCPGEFDPQWLMSREDLQGVLRVKSQGKLKGMTRKAKARMAELARRNWTKKYVVLSSKLMSVYIWSSDEQNADTRQDLLRIPYATIVAVKLFMPKSKTSFGSKAYRIELFTLHESKINVLVESAWKVKLWYDGFVAAGLRGASLAASRIQSMYRAWKARNILAKLQSRMRDGSHIVQREANKNPVLVHALGPERDQRFKLKRSRSLDIREIKNINLKVGKPQFIKRSTNMKISSKFARQSSHSALMSKRDGPSLRSPRGRGPVTSPSERYQGLGDMRGELKLRRTRRAVGVSLSSWKYHYFHLDTREGCLYFCDCKRSCDCQQLGKAARIDFSQFLTCNYFNPMKTNRLKTIQLKSSKAMQRVRERSQQSLASARRLQKKAAYSPKGGVSTSSPRAIPKRSRERRLNRNRSASPLRSLSHSPPKSPGSSQESVTNKFMLSTTNRESYYFMADTAQSATRWVDAILRVLPRENVAALAIQSCYRCYAARLKFYILFQQKVLEQQQVAAAIILQRFLRKRGSSLKQVATIDPAEPHEEPECA